MSGEGSPEVLFKVFFRLFYFTFNFLGISAKNLFIVSAISFLFDTLLSFRGFFINNRFNTFPDFKEVCLIFNKKTIEMIGFAESCEFQNFVFICFICIGQFLFSN